MENKERKMTIAGREFVIKADFKKSAKLTKYRNKIRYGSKIQVTEENRNAFFEIEKLRESTPEGKLPDITKLSAEAIKILNEMSTSPSEIFEAEELLEMGRILFELDSIEEVEELYNKELETTEYDILVLNIINEVQMVFTNAKDGFGEGKSKTVQVAEAK